MDILSVFKKSAIPAADKDFLTLCRRVEPNYTSSELVVASFQKTVFTNLINEYENLLNEMYMQRTDRNPAIKKIEETKKKNYEAVTFVKLYIKEKFGKDMAERYYPEFGLTKSSRGYNLPYAQEAHAAALEKMLSAVNKNGFAANKFGAAFWEPAIVEYKTLIATNNVTTESISGFGSRKNDLKEMLKTGLNQIRLIIRANYPNNYKAEWRKMGFLNERL